MKRSDTVFILVSFLIWRVGILIIAFFSTKYLPTFSHNFFGGGFSTYQANPLLWGNLNFDGEHYLSLAQNGYQPLTYFFFPLFPILIQFLSVSKDVLTLAWTGLLISNIAFLFSLFGIYKLITLDYKTSIAKMTVILLLIFPTTFYFGAYYTESVYFSLAVWGFYFMRQKKVLFASIMAALASASRVVGISLLIAFLFEFILSNKPRKFGKYIEDILSIIFISPVGVFIYMYYLLQTTGDPLVFLHQVSIYGNQRSPNLILIPQVLYRYFFKILPAINFTNFANTFSILLEFFVSVIFLTLIIYGFFKLRISYTVYSLLVFLIPTLSGSFSSMPRYVLAIFPVFILISILMDKLPKNYKIPIFFGMLILMAITTSLFWRGYWIS